VDLTGMVLPLTRPHVLVVPAPGGTQARLAVERALRERGWPVAAAPAEADLLVSCGPVGAGMATALEQAWQQVPAPRACVDLERADTTTAALEHGRARLLDSAYQRRDATTGRTGPMGSGDGDPIGHRTESPLPLTATDTRCQARMKLPATSTVRAMATDRAAGTTITATMTA
jgi:hypothetical protein